MTKSRVRAPTVLHVHCWLVGAVLAETEAEGGKENILQCALALKASVQISSLLTLHSPKQVTWQHPTPQGQESAALLCVCLWQAYWENDTMTICLWWTREKHLLIENLEGRSELNEAWYIHLMEYCKLLK